MNRLHTIILTIGFTSVLAHAADLTITVRGVRSTDGAVFLAVYDSDKSFLKVPQAKTTRRMNANKGDLKIVIQDLPAGNYAIASYHDENGNYLHHGLRSVCVESVRGELDRLPAEAGGAGGTGPRLE